MYCDCSRAHLELVLKVGVDAVLTQRLELPTDDRPRMSAVYLIYWRLA